VKTKNDDNTFACKHQPYTVFTSVIQKEAKIN